MPGGYFDSSSSDPAAPVTTGEKIAATAFRSPTQLAARLGARSPLRGGASAQRPNSPSRRQAHPDRGNRVFEEISGATGVIMSKIRAMSPTPQARNDDSQQQSSPAPADMARDVADKALNAASDFVHMGVERIDSAMSNFLPNTPIMVQSDGSTMGGDTATYEGGTVDEGTVGDGTVTLDDGTATYNDGTVTLEDGTATYHTYNDGTATYEDGSATLEDGTATYENDTYANTRESGSTFHRSAGGNSARSSGSSIHKSVFASASKSNMSVSASKSNVSISASKSALSKRSAQSSALKANARYSTGGRSVSSTNTRVAMDLRHNDNSFFVITDLILSRFKKEIMSKSPSMMISDSDRAHLDRTVPVTARDKFVEAVKFRLQNARADGTMTTVLEHCVALGLDRAADDDNILYARVNTLIAINQKDDDSDDDDETFQESIKKGSVKSVRSQSVKSQSNKSQSGKSFRDDGTYEVVGRVAPAPEQSRLPKVPLPQPPKKQEPPKVPDVLDVQIVKPTPEPEPESEADIERQELMEELRDASNLMAESVTPEATKFWRKQVVELQARLRRMNGDANEGPILRSVSTEDSMSVFSTQTESVASYHPPEPVIQEEKPKPRSVPVLAPTPAVVVPPKPTAPNPASALTPAKEAPKTPAPVASPMPDISVESPSMDPISTTRSNLSASSSYMPPTIQQSMSQGSKFRSPLARSPLMANDKNERLLYKKQELARSRSEDPSLDGLRIVDVVAPADLPGGYTFEAEIDSHRFLATVPKGGVREGETFVCFMRDLETVNPSTIPIGRWRDSLMSCFKHGFFHPTILLAWFCPLLALGQVMTRMELNFIGLPLGDRKGPSTWMILTRIVAFWALMNFAVIASFQAKVSMDLGISGSDLFALVFVNIAMYVFTVYVTANTRKTIRTAFHINEKHCVDFEDIFFSSFFLPFAISQLARHTASFEEYNGVCFSSTGLPENVKMFKRKPFEEDPTALSGKLV